MGIKQTPVIIKTPIKAVIDITEIENALMDHIGDFVVEAIGELVCGDRFDHDSTEMSDSDAAFEVCGTIVQEGTLIHIDACGLEPPEDSVEPDDIGFTEKQLMEKVVSRIWHRTSGDMWKDIIRRHMKLKLDEDDRQVKDSLF